MIPTNDNKYSIMVPPQLKNNGTFAGNTYVDTKGFGYLDVLVTVGTTDAAIGSTTATSDLYLEECDTTDGTYTSITGASVDSLSATDDNKSSVMSVKLGGSRKRYIRVNAPTAADGTTGANASIIGVLSRPTLGVTTATKAGLDDWAKV